ncbi:ribonuclease 3 [Methylopila jiangsuensis]|uniref:Ribonuclease 3 n=1 Tax=Methylopila jiangsuensis TaxID=586230 RepID=A0A9W6JGJ9_9HYPH|nr:ribonuclease III [Methylopila jiangsuensis]MDR6285871.1 ribonuclease-3 [Methylopila jiangsuensis]GLK75629.1 ribonuclease 3 [Methylopila jiangsuensis]
MRKRAIAHAEVETRIGHVFADRALLERALTHISAATSSEGRLGSYQRLEFLGDRVLGLAVASMLIEAFPTSDEGELSRRLAELVRAEACAEVAGAMDLAPFIRLGPGEQGSGGRRKIAILADVCEAVVGAVHLDGGYEKAAALVDRFWRPRMLAPRRPLRDAKTELQEWAQGRGLATPLYQEIERSGPDHNPHFRVAVMVDGLGEGLGAGRSKRAAEQDAARALLARAGVAIEGREHV